MWLPCYVAAATLFKPEYLSVEEEQQQQFFSSTSILRPKGQAMQKPALQTHKPFNYT